MNRKVLTEPEQINKKPYSIPEVLIFKSLKEITLANTCNCDYWGNHKLSCNWCDDPGGVTLSCPFPFPPWESCQ